MHWVGAILAIACLAYFFHSLGTHWRAVTDVSMDAHAWFAVGTALGIYLLTGVSTMVVWWLFLVAVGENASLYQALRINLVAQFGKYLPGNVGHLIGRVALARQAGMHVPAVLLSMTVETVWAVVVTGLLSLVCVMLVGERWLAQFGDLLSSATRTYALITAFVAMAIIVYALIRRWRRWRFEAGTAERRVRMPGVGAYAKTMVLIGGNFMLMGYALYLLGTNVFHVGAMNYLLITAAFVVAWTLGFVTPGAPAGLGIREVVLVGLLGSLGATNAVGIAALLRLITSLGDLLMFGLGLLLPRSGIREQA